MHTGGGFSAKSTFPHPDAYIAEVYFHGSKNPTLAEIIAAFDATRPGAHPSAPHA